MTVGAGAGPRARCGLCRHLNALGDRYCEQCGTRLAPVPPPGPSGGRPPPDVAPEPPVPPVRDGTTRYLCAAAHLDPQFAQLAIGEYLVEDVRSVPPSPGLDTAAVLRDAVAARRRGKIRDGLLLLLVGLSILLCFGPALLWLIMAVAGTAMTKGGTERDEEKRNVRRRSQVVVTVVLLGVVALLLLTGSGNRLLLTLGLYQLVSGGSALAAGLVALLVLTVLALDEAIVDGLTRTRFRPANFQPDGRAAIGWERVVRTLGLLDFDTPLRRVAAAAGRSGRPDAADVVVHRGWVPFVGAGTLVTDQTISLPLERADEERQPTPFTAAELNAHVRESMTDLRRSASLSPGRRLAGAQIHEQVFLPSDQLGRLFGTPLADVLVDPTQPPAAWIPVQRARALADEPVEAGRYYLCFRIEAWDRDLATSCFFTAATDQRMLYLEWSNSVLLPLRSRYRQIDRPADMDPFSRALLAAFALPVSVPARIANLFHSYKRVPANPGELVAERYGASRSLRELAAAHDSRNFFQDADAIRYVKLVEQALFRAVGDFLQARGYSITEVLSAARSRIANNNSITINGGMFQGNAIGIGRTEQSTRTESQHSDPRRTG